MTASWNRFALAIAGAVMSSSAISITPSGRSGAVARTRMNCFRFGNRIRLCARINRPPKSTSSLAVCARSQGVRLSSPSSRYDKWTGSWLTKLIIFSSRSDSWYTGIRSSNPAIAGDREKTIRAFENAGREAAQEALGDEATADLDAGAKIIRAERQLRSCGPLPCGLLGQHDDEV